jgi:hypothetical protein
MPLNPTNPAGDTATAFQSVANRAEAIRRYREAVRDQLLRGLILLDAERIVRLRMPQLWCAYADATQARAQAAPTQRTGPRRRKGGNGAPGTTDAPESRALPVL